MRVRLLPLALTCGCCFGFFFSSKTSTPSSTTKREVVYIAEDFVRGVPSYAMEKYSKEHFICDGGKVLTRNEINDNYCDCDDGSDEPGTNACKNGFFHCVNKGYRTLKIPSSRVDDGICDCCDGSDEATCEDVCESVASKEREMLEKLTTAYQSGSAIREANRQRVITEKGDDVAHVGAYLAAEKEQREEVERLQKLESEEAARIGNAGEIAREALQTRILERLNLLHATEGDLADFLVEFYSSMEFNTEDVQTTATNYRSSFPSKAPAPDDHVEDAGTPHHQHHDPYSADPYETAETEVAAPVEPTSQHSFSAGGCSLRHFNDDDRLETLCNYFSGPSQSLVEDLLKYVVFTLNQENAFTEASWITGYAVTRGMSGAGQIVRHQKALRGGNLEGSCPSDLASSNYCSMGAELLSFSQEANSIPVEVNVYQEQVREARDKLVEIETLARHSSENAKDLSTFANHLAFLTMKNECFEVDDAHFTYKVCPLESVTQTEAGSSGGVSLGTFDSVTDEDDGLAVVLHFKNGQYCHAFGPRSADVRVTCGEANKLLSASEPSTCFYTFAFESPNACTEAFARLNGLHI